MNEDLRLALGWGGMAALGSAFWTWVVDSLFGGMSFAGAIILLILVVGGAAALFVAAREKAEDE